MLHNALMHCAEQGSDGAISNRELRFLYPGVIGSETLAELQEAGFWSPTLDGYQLIGWSTTLGQNTASEIEGYREMNRIRQRKWREERSRKAAESAAQQAQALDIPVAQGGVAGEKKEALKSMGETRDITRDITRDVTVTVQARTGTAKAVPARAQDLNGPVPENSRQEPVDNFEGTGPEPPRAPPRTSPTYGAPLDTTAVIRAVSDHLPDNFDDTALQTLANEILSRAASHVHDPTAYVIATIRSWRQPNMTGADLVDAGEWLERVESIDRERRYQHDLVTTRGT
ncbi:hypothetical protein [Microbacterium saperdae]|uniref:hypothetical protein n=1 Tax=Microbacterium saperdae TaxID=69368 RepID=UPI00114FCB3A|nr:hypothetical protein [Microbacterium saperdae]